MDCILNLNNNRPNHNFSNSTNGFGSKESYRNYPKVLIQMEKAAKITEQRWIEGFFDIEERINPLKEVNTTLV